MGAVFPITFPFQKRAERRTPPAWSMSRTTAFEPHDWWHQNNPQNIIVVPLAQHFNGGLLEHPVRPRSHGLNQMVLLYVLHLRRPCHVRMHRWLPEQQQAAHQAHLLGVNVGANQQLLRKFTSLRIRLTS